MNTVEYKFLPGQTVYSAQERDVPYYTPCDLCESLGYVFMRSDSEKVKDIKLVCPKCKGECKTTSGGAIKCFVEEHTITEVLIRRYTCSYGTDQDINYELDGKTKLNQRQLFETAEEAQEYADKQNKRCIGYSS